MRSECGRGQLVTAPSVAGNVLWPLTDHLGTVRDLVDYDEVNNLSSIANHIAYDAFGRTISESNAAVDFLFGFTGRERDAESDLHYNRARYYDSATGRWISQDPIGFAAGDVNLYRYVGNGATNATDPSGLEEIDKYPTPFGPLNPRPNALPQPSIYTPWKNKEQLFPWQRPHGSGKDYIYFQRQDTIGWYISTGFSRDNANDVFKKGCFALASYRVGMSGRIVMTGPGVKGFTELFAAWRFLEEQVANGVKSRIVIIQSNVPPYIPPGHNPLDPLPDERPSGESNSAVMLHGRYDFAVLQWDSTQREYYWESQNDGCSDPKKGQYWRSAKPLSDLDYTVFMVVTITPEMEKLAQGLPLMPWKE